MDAVNIIVTMLAPGVLINCCGLLILGINNKYSSVVGRIRTLDEEKRKLVALADNEQLSKMQLHRLTSINLQTEMFFHRIKLVKNAVVSYSIGAAFLIATCMSIGVGFSINNPQISTIISILLFFLGILSVLVGIIYTAKEVIKGYEIVHIEVTDYIEKDHIINIQD